MEKIKQDKVAPRWGWDGECITEQRPKRTKGMNHADLGKENCRQREMQGQRPWDKRLLGLSEEQKETGEDGMSKEGTEQHGEVARSQIS